MKVSIITPTYNRGILLQHCYQSLLEQELKSFEWIIVDDGSSDETRQIAKRFMEEEKIEINYIFKKNGGKHTAVNIGVENAKGELSLILDSDDTLTSDAISIITKRWNEFKHLSRLGAFSFLKADKNGKSLATDVPSNGLISDYIAYRLKLGVKGDMCEVFRTEILKNYPFPIFPNERFLSEAVSWIEIAKTYKTIYFDHVIYKAEYLEGGLTSSIRKVQYNSPKGMCKLAESYLNVDCGWKMKLKYLIVYICFGLIDKKKIKEIFQQMKGNLIGLIFLFPVGYLVFKSIERDVLNQER